MKKILISLFVMLTLVGCLSQQEQTEKTLERSWYFYDPSARLCFMALDGSERPTSVTNVPCTPEVLNLIINRSAEDIKNGLPR